MNRRTLLLSSVVASVAGILRVRAKPVPQPERITIAETWDNKGVKWEMLDAQGKVRTIWESGTPMPYFFVTESPQVVAAPSGYQINQLMTLDTPPMFPEPHVITEKYAQTWEQVDPMSIYPVWRDGQLAKVIESTTDDTDS